MASELTCTRREREDGSGPSSQNCETRWGGWSCCMCVLNLGKKWASDSGQGKFQVWQVAKKSRSFCSVRLICYSFFLFHLLPKVLRICMADHNNRVIRIFFSWARVSETKGNKIKRIYKFGEFIWNCKVKLADFWGMIGKCDFDYEWLFGMLVAGLFDFLSACFFLASLDFGLVT